MKPINEFHLYGTMPTYNCFQCRNAHSARTCTTCGYRLSREEMISVLDLNENEIAYFDKRLS